MDASISQISTVINTLIKQTAQKRQIPKLQADLEMDNKESSSKYLIESNKIVYEKYDDYGRLILKVPLQNRIVKQKV